MYAKILSHTDMQRACMHARGKRLSGWNYGGCFSPGDAPAFSQHATRNVGHLIFSGDKKPSTLFKNKPGEKKWGLWIPVGAAQPFPKAQPPPVHGTPTIPAASLSAPPMGGGRRRSSWDLGLFKEECACAQGANCEGLCSDRRPPANLSPLPKHFLVHTGGLGRGCWVSRKSPAPA